MINGNIVIQFKLTQFFDLSVATPAVPIVKILELPQTKERRDERERDSRSLNKVAGETAVMTNAFISSPVPISIFSFRLWIASPLG